jgi:hypothetical protein
VVAAQQEEHDVRPTWIMTWAEAKPKPRSSNAPGSVADMTRLASIRPTSSSRTSIRSGSNQLVIHEV